MSIRIHRDKLPELAEARTAHLKKIGQPFTALALLTLGIGVYVGKN